MITRIEIDGFKSFLDFKLDMPPFLAIVGPNSSGKSNLFDALEYEWESRGPDSPLLDAHRGRPHELFHRVAKGHPVEMFSITTTRLLRIAEGLVKMTTSIGAAYEDGRPTETSQFTRMHPAEYKNEELALALRDRLRVGFDTMHGERAERAEAFAKTANLIESGMQGERQYVPEPHAMRRWASAADLRPLERDGANLAAVLGRMRNTEAFGDLMIDLAALIPDVVRVVPELDEKRQEWSFDLVIDGQGPVPSTLLSDGTLRVLGLLAALHDPDHPGVLMIEEIENGLHPSRLTELLRRMQDSVTDLNDPASLDRPLRQVILTSHSPVVVSELYRWRPESLIFMDSVVRVDPDHDRVSRVSVARPVRTDGERGTYVSPRQVHKYLAAVRQDEP
jgi:hypothetical protein